MKHVVKYEIKIEVEYSEPEGVKSALCGSGASVNNAGRDLTDISRQLVEAVFEGLVSNCFPIVWDGGDIKGLPGSIIATVDSVHTIDNERRARHG